VKADPDCNALGLEVVQLLVVQLVTAVASSFVTEWVNKRILVQLCSDVSRSCLNTAVGCIKSGHCQHCSFAAA
jgi:hypothetical protein